MCRPPDGMLLYEGFLSLPRAERVQITRCAQPEALRAVRAFYRLLDVSGVEEPGHPAWLRLVYCVPYLRHTPARVSLGAAIARGRVGERPLSEARLLQCVRSQPPLDLLHLQRILRMLAPLPRVHWPHAAALLWHWGPRSKQRILEGFFLTRMTG